MSWQSRKMKNRKQKIALDDLTKRFNSFLGDALPGQEVAGFSRDSIVGALGKEFVGVSPPFPGLLPPSDRRKVEAYYSKGYSDEYLDAAHQEREILASVFAQFLRDCGETSYFLFSEAFYDDPSYEEEKAFLLSVDYDFSRFMEEESLTALMASADTVLCSEDFTRMLIFFHHNWYELYDRNFADRFRAFARQQNVSLRRT